MRHRLLTSFLAVVTLVCSASMVFAADDGLKKGAVSLKSAGPLAFGPSNVLFVGDAKAATVYAVKVEAFKSKAEGVSYDVPDIGKQAAAAGGPGNIVDMAVNPADGAVYFSYATPSGGKLLRVAAGSNAKPSVHAVDLSKVMHAKSALPNAPVDKMVKIGRREKNPRLMSITDLAYHEGTLYVSGLTGSKNVSSVRDIVFPFNRPATEAHLEIYHAAHGRVEDYAPAQVVLPFTVDGKPNLLAGYICTPLVRFEVEALKPSKKVRGTTIAELGNRNKPLDMIVYKQGGKHYLLMANSARGVMKISTDDIASNKGLTEKVSGGNTAGQRYETIKALKGVVQLDKLGDDRAVILSAGEGGKLRLQTIELP